tara:strand:- start:2732 stop:3067 length:336 start_codon:yes stop_codon:yes gene_type:complete
MKEKDMDSKDEKREAIYIEINWDTPEDLSDLANNREFQNFILEETLTSIVDALENNLSKAELFNIFNMSVILEIEKSQFKVVLEKINSYLIREEEYERCTQIQNLIKINKL